ncbi:tRNA (adenine(22)-N(1))-methyltransferase [Granulicatella seriolae]|uniref:tRNA (Adenine(22)-N(1))-methyltransferase TrmK n=1 Tax=Granulicatella seriolae TaxID=2967226 RepID=A0ABT1WN15_9LACT|nr:tRNA (adenine(22)-N(1))-methyltransferase TrmK [Granulicatella seriolae]
MIPIQLSTRLLRVANYVPQDAILADIGSDHAYLPIYLLQNQTIQSAIAGEVVQGPYQSAKTSSQEYGLEKLIDVRMGDGLNVLKEEDQVTVITICGMGGELISQILEEGYLKEHLAGVETLILQPNVAEYQVRKWLLTHGYAITNEEILADNKRIYEIIVAKPTHETPNYSEVQLKHGIYLTQTKPVLAKEKWQQLIEKHKFVLKQLQKSSQKQDDKIAQIQNEIAQLEELIM